METNDSNIKPQQTGGLKLMTVFIAVLALHVVVIGGFTVYHLMSGGSTDADLLTDKSHKNVKITSDGAVASDSTTPDASQADKSTAPAADQTASTENNASTPVASSNTPTGPMQTGPVIDPPVSSTPASAPTTAAATEPASTPAFEPASEIGGAPYVVKSHDSLARIAHQNHTSVAKLKAANNLTTDMLHIGQKLVIPARTQVASATAPAANAEASGSTTILSSSTSAPSMKVPATTIPSAPKPTTVAAHSQTMMSPATPGHHLYTVVKGDTLTKIARKFKTTPTAIMTANSITDPAKLSVGKKLKIPGQEARSATTEAPATEQQAPQTQTKPGASAQLANFLQ